MMKLRVTGFECLPTAVILRAKSRSPKRDEARHWATKLVSVFQNKLKSFPIVSDVIRYFYNAKLHLFV